MAKRKKTGQGASKRERRLKQQKRQLETLPPRLGHETMLAVVKPLRDAADDVLRVLRRNGADAPELMQEEHLARPKVDEFLRGRLHFAREYLGWDEDACLLDLEQLTHHLFCVVDFEASGRKAFWVSPELVELLANTNLDISGELLELPFASCAFLFRDETTCSLAAALMQGAETRQTPKTVTAYVRPIAESFGQRGVKLTFLFDDQTEEWPYLLTREVPTADTRNLDEILDSHPAESVDPVFRSPEMRKLLHLVINAILYTTSESFRGEERGPAPKSLSSKSQILSGERVFYLPGRIPISNAPSDELSRPRKGGRSTLSKRFWVRGHWRRPNPSWTDPRIRWVRPYLKGPDMAVIVEREYELKAGGPRGDLARPAPNDSTS